MSKYLDIDVHDPIESLLRACPQSPDTLPGIAFRISESHLVISISEHDTLTIRRRINDMERSESSPIDLPNDVDEQVAGP